MSSDKNDVHHQDQSDTSQQSGQVAQLGDTPSGKSSFPLRKGLLFEDYLEHSDTFSLDNLRKNLPDPKERVEAIWCFLSAEFADRAVGMDRCFLDLAMLDELVRLGGFGISDNDREYFYEHFVPPFNARCLKADS